MNKQNTYKETKINWLGYIPSNWDLKRVSQFFKERSEKVDDKSFPPLSVTKFGVIDQLKEVAKTNDRDNRKLVKKNDFVINSRSDRKGSSGIAKRDGSVSLINIVLEPHFIEPKFIEYLFKSYYFKEEFFRNGKGIHWDLWTTKWDQFKNIYIPIPSKIEQTKIANYLEKKTEKIDLLIKNIERKIDLLNEQKVLLTDRFVTRGIDNNVELKESEVDWIGKIPSNWSMKKLKYLFDVELSTVDRHISEKEKKIFICHYPDVYKNEYIDKNTKLSNGSCSNLEFSKFTLTKGDILLTKDSESPEDIGIPTYILEDIENAVCGYHIAIIRSKNNILSSEFLFRYLESKSAKDYFYISSNGITRYGLGKNKIESIYVSFPSLEIQIKIIKKIRLLSSYTKKIISFYKKKIELLKESRESLIYSVVTGKISVKE